MVNLMIKSFKVAHPGDKQVSSIEVYKDNGEWYTLSNDSEQETKSVTLTYNGDINILPDEGYGAMKKVVVTTAIPNKLYAWLDSNNTLMAYTFGDEPAAGDKAYVCALTGLVENTITQVDPHMITIEPEGEPSISFSRHIAGDIEIPGIIEF